MIQCSHKNYLLTVACLFITCTSLPLLAHSATATYSTPSDRLERKTVPSHPTKKRNNTAKHAEENYLTQLRNQSAEHIYHKADTAFNEENNLEAIQLYKALYTLHPTSQYAELAQFQLIKSYYQAEDMHATVKSARQFIRLYPHSTRIENAYYLKALANFHQNRDWFFQLVKVDLARRDLGTIRESWKDFLHFTQMFPRSPYIPEAKDYLNRIEQLLANYELYIIDFYFRKKNYLAVINRTTQLIQDYANTVAAATASTLKKAAEAILQRAPNTLS
jgi:outer membrane protein assembly factor BamD